MSASIEDIRAVVRHHATREADEWLDDWLRTWVPALQAKPIDLLESEEGRQRVLSVLQQSIHGVYA